MKRFKLKFDWKYQLAVYAGIVLCIVLLVGNIFRLVNNNGFGDVYSTITYIFIFLLALLAPALLLSVLYHSSYIVENGKFITEFGFIRSDYSLAQFTELIYNAEKSELNIVMGDKYMIFKVDATWIKEFVAALKKENKNILYNETDDMPDISSDNSKKEK